MGEVVLTLQMPKGNRFIPITMTVDPVVLQAFKRAVLRDHEKREQLATDELEAILQRAELEKLRKILDLLIPEIEATKNV
jgi:hypothetical protein